MHLHSILLGQTPIPVTWLSAISAISAGPLNNNSVRFVLDLPNFSAPADPINQ